MRKHLISLLLVLTAQPVFALQLIEATEEGATYHARFSRDEMTRLAIREGRIVSMHFPDGRLTVEKDDAGGYALLRARDDDPVSLVVTSSSGQTHSIFLTPEKMGMDTIIIREKPTLAAGPRIQGAPDARADSQSRSVKRLMLAMARDEKVVRDFMVEPVGSDIDLWNEVHFHMADKYTGPDVVGYRFILTNVTGSPIRLGEQEFYKRGVVAVAIDRHILAPGEKTYVFVIMVRSDKHG